MTTETYWTRKQVAARFNVSERTVDRWILDGKLHPTRIEADITQFVAGEK